MKPIQNLVTLQLTAPILAAVDAALAELETHLSALIYLTPTQKVTATKMGAKSADFCRQALTVLSQRPDVLPAGIKLADATADLETREQLRPRLARLTALFQRAFDTDIALGSNVMAMALYGYKQLKLNGGGTGLEALQREAAGRFGARRRRAKTVIDQPAG